MIGRGWEKRANMAGEQKAGSEKLVAEEKDGEKEEKEDVARKRRGRPKKGKKEKEDKCKDKEVVKGMKSFLEMRKITKGKKLVRTPVKTKETGVGKEGNEKGAESEEDGSSSEGERAAAEELERNDNKNKHGRRESTAKEEKARCAAEAAKNKEVVSVSMREWMKEMNERVEIVEKK